MQRHVRQHRLHQRLIGEMLLEHAAVPCVMQRMRQPRPHQAGGGDRAILPGQLHHLDDGSDSLALVADALGISAMKLHLRGGIGAVAELVLQPLEPDRVNRPVRRKARHEEATQSLLGLGQHQEGVAHRRRHEPFVAGDAIGIPVGFGPRHVGAHVGAALLLGHPHAERHAALGPPRGEGRVVGACSHHRHHLGQEIRLLGQRRHGGPRHGDRAEMPGLDLRGHVEFCRAYHLGRAAGRVAGRVPGRIMHAGMGAARHQLMIGRVKLDFVAPVAA